MRRECYRGIYRGFCMENRDPWRTGRIQAVVPEVYGWHYRVQWASPAYGMKGEMRVPNMAMKDGQVIEPKEALNQEIYGDEVWISFLDGDPERPVWLAAWIGGKGLKSDGSAIPDVPAEALGCEGIAEQMQEASGEGDYEATEGAIPPSVGMLEFLGAYKAQYPYNRMVKTPSGHVIAWDDTLGSERIFLFHKDGHFLQMGPAGEAAEGGEEVEGGEGVEGEEGSGEGGEGAEEGEVPTEPYQRPEVILASVGRLRLVAGEGIELASPKVDYVQGTVGGNRYSIDQRIRGMELPEEMVIPDAQIVLPEEGRGYACEQVNALCDPSPAARSSFGGVDPTGSEDPVFPPPGPAPEGGFESKNDWFGGTVLLVGSLSNPVPFNHEKFNRAYNGLVTSGTTGCQRIFGWYNWPPHQFPWRKKGGRYYLREWSDTYWKKLKGFIHNANRHRIVVFVEVIDWCGLKPKVFNNHALSVRRGGPLRRGEDIFKSQNFWIVSNYIKKLASEVENYPNLGVGIGNELPPNAGKTFIRKVKAEIEKYLPGVPILLSDPRGISSTDWFRMGGDYCGIHAGIRDQGVRLSEMRAGWKWIFEWDGYGNCDNSDAGKVKGPLAAALNKRTNHLVLTQDYNSAHGREPSQLFAAMAGVVQGKFG